MQVYEVYPTIYHHILVCTSIYEYDHSYPWYRDSRCSAKLIARRNRKIHGETSRHRPVESAAGESADAAVPPAAGNDDGDNSKVSDADGARAAAAAAAAAAVTAAHYIDYTNYTHYLQVLQDLGHADHLWQDKRTLIAQSVENLGYQFRPAMRARWLSFISRAYSQDGAADAGPVVGEGNSRHLGGCRLSLRRCCYEQRSPVMDDAIVLYFAMNSNPKCDFLFSNNANNKK
jgi:hypothetical protein